MKNRKRLIPLLLLVLIAAGAFYIYTRGWPEILTTDAAEQANVVSGYIEGEEINIVAETGGRIAELNVEEGTQVSQGQKLAQLDRTLVEAQLAQAQAAIQTAEAQLAQVRAGARPEDVRQAQAALAQAAAARDGAKQAWVNAQAARNNPQELDARITAAETQYKTAKFNLDAALANAQSAATLKDQVGVDNPNPNAKVIVQQWVAAEAAVQTAQAALDGARQALEVLQGMKANPLTANAQVDAAKAQYDAAATAVDVAQARLDAVSAGPTAEQITVAEAQVNQARAAQQVLQVQADKLALVSPVSGIVTRRALRAGEVAGPGATLLTVSQLDPVTLTIYVPETEIGRIQLGQQVAVQLDSFPGRTFMGKVTLIGTQAEFTPRNVQTKAERVNMVFAVKVELPNKELELKPGMPADALLARY